MLWLGSGAPHSVTAPARSWATLLGLPDPDNRGARRIRDAIVWLEERRFITVDSPPGVAPTLMLLNELRTGMDYSVPGAAIVEARAAGELGEVSDRYVQLPAAFWENGWVATLSGAGTAMLLVLLHADRSRGREIWFSPSTAKATYELSRDTRSAGLTELAGYGVVSISRRPVQPSALAQRRMRNAYVLHLDELNKEPLKAPS